MKRLLLLVLALGSMLGTALAVNTSTVPGYKSTGSWVTVISPSTPQTWSFFEIKRHRLQWKSKQNVFQCTLTLTNQPWAGGGESDTTSPETETYFIVFPQIKPIGDGLYGARNDEGKMIPLCKDSGGGIELLPTTRVNLFSFSGKLVIAMLGTTNQGFAADSGDPWVIYNHGFQLQNLLQNSGLSE